MKKITVSSPGKLMIMGEHAVVYNHPCIVTAVGQRMRVTVELIAKNELQLSAPDVQISNYKKSIKDLGKGKIPKGVMFVELAVRNFLTKYPLKHGVSIQTSSEFSSKFGFGSSSASTVCVIKALSELTEKKLSKKQLFDIAYKTVLDVQGKGSGFDVAAAIYGGTLFFVTGGKVIEPLDIDSLPIIIGYSGVKADTVTLMNQVKALSQKKPDLVSQIYDSIDTLVVKAKQVILKQDWKTLGELMNENQTLLKKLGVSTTKLNNMIGASIQAGAYGAKLSGAGGGDCMFAVVTKTYEDKVKKSIARVGELILIKINDSGVRIEN